FFQAEDGIRDPLVTGVQTCALPICLSPIWALAESASESVGMSAVSSLSRARSRPDMLWPVTGGLYLLTVGVRRMPFERITEIDRSEERRVGKEWRVRVAVEQCKEKE